MGQDLSMFGNGTKTNFLKEFDIKVDQIVKCEYHKSNEHYTYDIYPLDVMEVKNVLLQLEDCYYKNTNYIFNHKHHINLIYNDGTSLMLALSNSGEYVGKPTSASGWGIWFYLKDDKEHKYTPFNRIIALPI